MATNDPLQADSVSLVASLYSAVTDRDRFAICRAECEDWLAQQRDPASPAAAFLRLQVRRATEARTLAAAGRSSLPTACAVMAVDDHGRVLAASPETRALFGGGASEDEPLRLPLSLRAFVEDAGVGTAIPRALRVPLDDGSTELAGIVLGVDQVSHAAGAMRVMTFLLCDVGVSRDRQTGGRAEVKPFRRVARGRKVEGPYEMALAADRSA